MHTPFRLTVPIAALLLTACLPHTAAAQAFDLLVSNNKANSVSRFDAETGEFLGDLVPPNLGGLGGTQEVLLGHDGALLVAGINSNAVLSYDARTGEYLGPFTTGYSLQGATKTQFGPDGNLYVSQWGTTQTSVAVFDGDTGAFLREATPNLIQPMGQAWDSEGVLHVSSWGGADVRKYDADGNEIGVVVAAGGAIQGPVNIWFDDDEVLWVIDWTSGRIIRYTHEGELIDIFAAGLANPEGWAYGPDGALYVAEWNGVGVRKLDPETGLSLGTIGAGAGLNDPNDVFFMPAFPDFSLSAPSSHTTVSSSSSGSLQVLVRPERGMPFDDAVTVSCTTDNPIVSCTPSPATVTPGADTASVTLTFTRTAESPFSVPGFDLPTASPLFWVAIASMLLMLILPSRRAPRSRLVMALSVLMLGVGCGGGSEPIGPEIEDLSTTVSVVAEADGIQRYQTLSVSIDP